MLLDESQDPFPKAYEHPGEAVATAFDDRIGGQHRRLEAELMQARVRSVDVAQAIFIDAGDRRLAVTALRPGKGATRRLELRDPTAEMKSRVLSQLSPKVFIALKTGRRNGRLDKVRVEQQMR